MSSGVAATARSIIARTAGSLLGDLLALVVGQREHVQQQRLLDLGRVEQVAAALGRELRVVGQDDRGAEHRVVGRVASTGNVLTLSHVITAVAASSGGETATEAPARAAADDDVGRQQREAQRLARGRARGHVGRVLHADGDAHAARRRASTPIVTRPVTAPNANAAGRRRRQLDARRACGAARG